MNKVCFFLSFDISRSLAGRKCQREAPFQAFCSDFQKQSKGKGCNLPQTLSLCACKKSKKKNKRKKFQRK